MIRFYLTSLIVLILTGLVFAYSQSRPTPQTRPTTDLPNLSRIEREVSTQQRINRYFHGDLMPTLKNCWSSLRGKGTISMKYTYNKSGAKWIFDRLEVDQSTLPRGQDAIAMKCMLVAVSRTSFPVEATESQQSTFVLFWTWPVPFPTNNTQLTSAMFAARPGLGVSGGCDGLGTPAKCLVCGTKANTCDKVCVGSKSCTIYPDGSCIGVDACASGGPFGVSGGSRIIF